MTRHYTKSGNADSSNMGGPDVADTVLPASGIITYDDFNPIEIVVDAVADKKKWLDDMQFMNERITIRINETSDPNQEPRVPVCVNGEPAHPKFGNHLPRGVPLVVKRNVAEALLRAKPISVKTIDTKDGQGYDTTKIVRSIGNLYPFEVVNPTQKDTEWMRSIRAQA